MKDTFKLEETVNKDLHFVVGSETVSCHQSMFIPNSKFLRGLLRDRISRAGVQDVTIVLTEVKVATVRSLVEYIYTGKTNISRIKEVNEIDSLRRLLQLKIDIDKKIFPLDKSKNSSKSRSEEKSNQPERHKSEGKPKENISEEKSRQRHHSGKKSEQTQQKSKPTESCSTRTNSAAECGEVSQEKSKDGKLSKEVAPTKAQNNAESPIKVIKKEKGLNSSTTSEGDPYNLVKPLKLRVKLETNPEPSQELNDSLFGGSSMFHRILKSISGDVNTEEGTDGGTEVETDGMTEVETDGMTEVETEVETEVGTEVETEAETEAETEVGSYQTARQEMEEELAESDSSDSSDSDSSSESDSDSDSEDAIPQLPADGQDGVPSLNTELLLAELSKDEERLNRAITEFLHSGTSVQPRPCGECSECGHLLSQDNFVLHHGIHLEDVKQAKLRLVYPPDRRGQEEARMEWSEGQEVKQEIPVTSSAPGTGGPAASLPPSPPPEKEGVEQEIDKLQQDQQRISQGINSFMDKMQRGARQLECTECQDTVTMINLVSHFHKHILDLHQQIESLVKKKNENKRKLETGRKETPRKRLKESRPPPAKPKTAVSSEESVVSEGRERLGSEEERKKMYKRIYGRKKYQYKINRRAEDVKVSEEEIDAEIAKEKAKYSGQPALGGDLGETVNMSPGELLRSFVQFGSKEYKHEFKKARDRLYKRKLRVLRMQGIMDNSAALDIPRSDIEVEMLSRYTANRNVKTEENKDMELTQEAAEDRRNVHEDDLELSLDVDDVGELFAGAETIMGDTSLSALVSEITDENTMPSILTDIVVGTTLEEGVQQQNLI